MAKAVITRRFDATDTKKGISMRIEPSDEPQTLPEWVIALAEEAGAATRAGAKTATPSASAPAAAPKE